MGLWSTRIFRNIPDHDREHGGENELYPSPSARIYLLDAVFARLIIVDAHHSPN